MPFSGHPNPFQVYMHPWFPTPPVPPPPVLTPANVSPKQHLDEPLSSPLRCDITVSEFCQLHDLGGDIEVGPDKLGFEIGDDLECVTEKHWMDAGFKPLAWNRVEKIYQKFKHENRV